MSNRLNKIYKIKYTILKRLIVYNIAAPQQYKTYIKKYDVYTNINIFINTLPIMYVFNTTMVCLTLKGVR